MTSVRTPAQKKALGLAAMNCGYLAAGYNVIRGSGYNVRWSVLNALVRRGLMRVDGYTTPRHATPTPPP